MAYLGGINYNLPMRVFYSKNYRQRCEHDRDDLPSESSKGLRVLAMFALQYVLIGLVLFYYTFFLYTYFVPTYTGCDPNGYHVAARIFSASGRFDRTASDDYSFIGRMWVRNDAGRYFPKYPPLYPALAGTAIRLFGETAGFYVSPVCAFLGVLGIYVLGRLFGMRWMAIAAAFFLATSPAYNSWAIRQMSHAASMGFLISGYAFFLIGERLRRRAASRVMLFLGGVVVAYAAGIRYTNVLLAFPPLFLALCGRRTERDDRCGRTAAYVLGLALPYLFLAYYHWKSFGSPFVTGYALTGEQSGFAWEYFHDNWRFYLLGIIESGVGPVFLPACFGLFYCWERSRRDGFFFTIWVLPVVLLYAAYYWAPETNHQSFLRFVLPVFVPAFLLSCKFLGAVVERFREHRGGVIAFVVLFVLGQGGWGMINSFIIAEQQFARGSAQDRSIKFIRRVLADRPDAVIFADQGLLEFLDFYGTYTLYPSDVLYKWQIKRVFERALEPGPSGLQKERALFLKENLFDADWKTYHVRIRALFEKPLADGRDVYVIGQAGQIEGFKKYYLRYFEIEDGDSLGGRPPEYRLVTPMKQSSWKKFAERVPRRLPNSVSIARVVGIRTKPLAPDEELKLLQGELEEAGRQLAPDGAEGAELLRYRDSLIRQIDQLRRLIAENERKAEQKRKQQEEAAAKKALEKQRKEAVRSKAPDGKTRDKNGP